MNAEAKMAAARSLVCWLTVAASGWASAAERMLEPALRHLRAGPVREWVEFPEASPGSILTVEFDARRNATPGTLTLRQQDVRLAWKLELNGKLLGRLTADEGDLLARFAVPAGTLVEGRNRVVVSTTDTRTDDIRVGAIKLDDRALDTILSEAALDVTVTDADGGAIPCRVTIVDADGCLVPLAAVSGDRTAVRPGMVNTADGKARFGVPAGRYTVFAGRGSEWSVDARSIDAAAGSTTAAALRIRREVDTSKWVACDTHIHTLTFSRHGDATATERAVTIAAEGIELAVATDHNMQIDLEPYAVKAGVRRWFTPVIGNEVTTKVGHFNAFPVRIDSKLPDAKATSWVEIFDGIAAAPGIEIVTLNHPRDLHGIRVFDARRFNDAVGRDLDGWKLRANAVEVVTSAAMQTDGLRLFHDWFALLNRGLPVTPIGSSDSHEVARYLLGQGRTYIRCDDADPGTLDVNAAYRALREGRVGVSLGLFVEMTVDGKLAGDLVRPAGPVRVECRVSAPHWIRADRITLYANGIKVREERIEPSDKGGLKWAGGWTLPAPAHDVHLVAVATGPGVTAPYWRMPKPYQPTSTTWTPYVLGSTGAVWIDADGDGKPTGAFAIARRLTAEAKGDAVALLAKLNGFDEAVAAQAADILADAGVVVDEAKLAAAGEQVRRGFDRYAEAARAAREAGRK